MANESLVAASRGELDPKEIRETPLSNSYKKDKTNEGPRSENHANCGEMLPQEPSHVE
jgi:hypothetical protein